jgi:DNA-directed RNA polymerase specialized sigma24 family protein
VIATYRALGVPPRIIAREPVLMAPLDDITVPHEDQSAAVEAREWIARALESLPRDERLAVQLFIVDELSAVEVARAVGWPNAKAVYNRVYRALAALRASLEKEGIRRGDL